MKKRILTLALCAILAAASLAGCAGGSDATTGSSAPAAAASSEATGTTQKSSGGTIKLEFFQQQGEEAIQAGYKDLCAAFNAENPGVEIEMNTVPDAVKALTSRFASNDIPPIFNDYPTQLQFKQKVSNDYIMELTGQDFLTRVEDSALALCKQPDGGDYALPYLRNFMGVYYSIDIFEANGIEIPTTWDEFIAVCDKLQAAGITPLQFPFKDQTGHFFQATTVALNPTGIDTLEKVAAGEAQIEGNAEFRRYSERILKIASYGTDDAFGAINTVATENFANGSAAMFIAGSYIRGNLKLANPDFNFGVFQLPNDTRETTTALAGINASHCISNGASDEEKEIGLKFLEFMSRPENAQKWSDTAGEVSCIIGVNFADTRLDPILNFIKEGPVHDWMGSSINNNIVNDLYSVTQGFLMNQDIDQYLKDMDESIRINAAE